MMNERPSAHELALIIDSMEAREQPEEVTRAIKRTQQEVGHLTGELMEDVRSIMARERERMERGRPAPETPAPAPAEAAPMAA